MEFEKKGTCVCVVFSLEQLILCTRGKVGGRVLRKKGGKRKSR